MRTIVSVLCTVILLVGLASAAVGAASGKQLPPRAVMGLAGIEAAGGRSVRIAGANRYATAVAISETSWTYEDTVVVFLATGDGFADALAAGPSTFASGPLLLTQRDTLPEETRAELQRLRPCMVVAVGGPAVISDEVVAQADAYTEDCSTE